MIDWYKDHLNKEIKLDDTFVVWSCKTLQNYKCIVSTIYGGLTEYTYNGDKGELYEDVYKKLTNNCYK